VQSLELQSKIWSEYIYFIYICVIYFSALHQLCTLDSEYPIEGLKLDQFRRAAGSTTAGVVSG
jgi:hypothetical protein